MEKKKLIDKFVAYDQETRLTVPDSSMSSTDEMEIFEDPDIGSTSSEPGISYGKFNLTLS